MEGILPIKTIPLACFRYILTEEISIIFQISHTIYFDHIYSFPYSKSSWILPTYPIHILSLNKYINI